MNETPTLANYWNLHPLPQSQNYYFLEGPSHMFPISSHVGQRREKASGACSFSKQCFSSHPQICSE